MDCFSCKYHSVVDDGVCIEFCQCSHPQDEELDFHYDYCPTVRNHKDDCPYYESNK